MAPPDTIWHKESLKLKEIFGTREGFEICPNKFSHRLVKAPSCTGLGHNASLKNEALKCVILPFKSVCYGFRQCEPVFLCLQQRLIQEGTDLF